MYFITSSSSLNRGESLVNLEKHYKIYKLHGKKHNIFYNNNHNDNTIFNIIYFKLIQLLIQSQSCTFSRPKEAKGLDLQASQY